MISKVHLFSSIGILLFITGITSSDPIGRIVGGFPMSIEQVPYQVSIQMVEMDGFIGHFCGGSIINDKFILTASHCLESLELSDLAILVGKTSNRKKAQKNKIKRIIMHSKFDRTNQDYDIALLELKTPLKFNDQIAPIQIVDGSDQVLDGTLCLASGWGDTNEEMFSENNNLRGVLIPIVNQNRCKKDYKKHGKITTRMFCAGESQKDTYQGDSGGPLACHLPSRGGNLSLVGIVSWGVECGKQDLPGVYTRLTSLRQWIRDESGI